MNNIYISQNSLYQIFIYFFIYSFLGWCTEVIYATIKSKKFVNRGFFNGPICPIYGVGFIIALLTLKSFLNNIFLLFVFSVLLTTILEFITGFLLEKFFNKKWWDYSDEPFNIMGYVCLKFSFFWGISCVLILKVLHPIILFLINLIPLLIGYILLVVLTVLFIIDLTVTILQIIKLNKKFKQINKLAKELTDTSNLVGKKVSSITLDVAENIQLLKSRILNTRLIKAFPSLFKNKDNEKKNK